MSDDNPEVSDGRIEPDDQARDLAKIMKGREKKLKTEPANPFGQFMKHKRAKEGEVIFGQVLLEWKQMSEEDKGFYRNCYEEDKAALGDNYRAGRKRKRNKKNEKIQENKSSGKKGPKVQEVERKKSNLDLLTKCESLDGEIDQFNLEARGLQKQICDEKVKLAVNQFKLDEKTNECNSLKDKYKALVSQHSNC